MLAKETDWGVLCAEEWADPCEKKNTISRNSDQLERKPSKFIPVLSMASNKVKKR